MVELTVDGNKVEVPEGSMVMHAAQKIGLYVPHFCYHKKLSIAANCRMCLVEVEKAPKALPACATPVTNGMVVHTCSEKARAAQQSVMEFLLINHRWIARSAIRAASASCRIWPWAMAALPRVTRKRSAWCSTGPGPAGVGRGNEPLHPLHPLRALRPGNRRRHGTGHARPWRTLRDHVLRGPLDRVRTVGQHDRHLSGGRADLQALPLQRAHLGAGPPPLGQPARQPGRQPGHPGQGRPRHARGAVRGRSRQRMLDQRPRPLLV